MGAESLMFHVKDIISRAIAEEYCFTYHCCCRYWYGCTHETKSHK